MKVKSASVPEVYNKGGRLTSKEPVIFHACDISTDTIWALYFDWDIEIEGWEFTVPRLASTNLGTVPWFLRWFISPNDPLIAIPSIAHDFIVNEWGYDITFTDAESGAVMEINDSDIPWNVSTKLFLNFGYKRATSRKDRLKILVVYYGMLAYGFILNK